MTRSAGTRRKTRRKLKKGLRDKLTLPMLMKGLKMNEKVVIKINPSIQKGMPHPRYQGKSGEVVEKKGRSYVVKIKDGNKPKTLNVHPTHLKKVEK